MLTVPTLADPVHYMDLAGANYLEYETTLRPQEREEVAYTDTQGKLHRFRVMQYEEIHHAHHIYAVYAEGLLYALKTVIPPQRIFQQATGLYVMRQMLAYSDWELGTCDVETIADISFFREDLFSILYRIAATYGGEISTEYIGNRKILHFQRRISGDHGHIFDYRKNLRQVKRTVDTKDTITALYGYGKGEQLENGQYGRRITFASLTGGKEYVERADLIPRYGTDGKHSYGVVIYDDVTEPAELLRLTTAELETRSTPKIAYDIDAVDLGKLGFPAEAVELGEIITVRDADMELDLKTRILRVERHLDPAQPDRIVLGNYTPNLVSAEVRKQQALDTLRKEMLMAIESATMDDVLAQINDEINKTGGYTYFVPGEGMTTYDKPIEANPTQAVQIKGGAIRIANTRKPDGTWDWRTVSTGDGIIADTITSGKLRADLITGTLTESVQIHANSLIVDDNFKASKLGQALQTAIRQARSVWEVSGRSGLHPAGVYAGETWATLTPDRPYPHQHIGDLGLVTFPDGGVPNITASREWAEHVYMYCYVGDASPTKYDWLPLSKTPLLRELQDYNGVKISTGQGIEIFDAAGTRQAQFTKNNIRFFHGAPDRYSYMDAKGIRYHGPHGDSAYLRELYMTRVDHKAGQEISANWDSNATRKVVPLPANFRNYDAADIEVFCQPELEISNIVNPLGSSTYEIQSISQGQRVVCNVVGKSNTAVTIDMFRNIYPATVTVGRGQYLEKRSEATKTYGIAAQMVVIVR